MKPFTNNHQNFDFSDIISKKKIIAESSTKGGDSESVDTFESGKSVEVSRGRFDMANELDSPQLRPKPSQSSQDPWFPLTCNKEHPNIHTISPKVLGVYLKQISKATSSLDTSPKDHRELQALQDLANEETLSLSNNSLQSVSSSSLSDLPEEPSLNRDFSLKVHSTMNFDSNSSGGTAKIGSLQMKEEEAVSQEEEEWVNECLHSKGHWTKNLSHELLIFDCRYNFEYRGGHIQGALNVNRPSVIQYLFKTLKDHMFDRDFLQALKQLSPGEVTIDDLAALADRFNQPKKNCTPVGIFHCEFSSKRGPKMWNFLRGFDREMNIEIYPEVTYPQIFLLKSGYSCFVIEQGDLCFPKHRYTSMFEEDFKKECHEQKCIEGDDWNSVLESKGKRKRKNRSNY